MRVGRPAAALAFGALALVAGSLLAPHAPPLYDGIGFPDEPYRYAQTVADDPVKTPPPTTASATLKLAAGTNAEGIVLSTAESGPQLLAFVPKGAVIGMGGETTIGIAATPLAPDMPPPADGLVAGDIYRLATATPARWTRGLNGTLSLRSPQGIPIQPTLEFRAAGQPIWQPLRTTRVGTDIWESPLEDLGDYALVLARRDAAKPAGSGGTPIYLGAAGVGLIAAILLGVRLGMKRRRVPAT